MQPPLFLVHLVYLLNGLHPGVPAARFVGVIVRVTVVLMVTLTFRRPEWESFFESSDKCFLVHGVIHVSQVG